MSKIISAKLKKGTHLEVTLEEGVSQVTRFFKHREADQSLTVPFGKLAYHIAAICEQWSEDVDTGLDTDNIEARGFYLKGEDEKEGIVLTGLRTLTSGKVIVLNTPFLNAQDEAAYPEISKLVADIDVITTAITAYIEANKEPEVKQTTIPFPAAQTGTHD